MHHYYNIHNNNWYTKKIIDKKCFNYIKVTTQHKQNNTNINIKINKKLNNNNNNHQNRQVLRAEEIQLHFILYTKKIGGSTG
jgi:hypothetical protein